MTIKKVLFTAKVDSHIRHFHLPFLKLFKDNGYLVHVASQGDDDFIDCDQKYDIKFGTNPFSKSVFESYRILKKIISENEYEIIHTHTAIASVLTRLVAHQVNKSRSTKARVIYTAHGFHFLKGGPISSWLIYYPIERYFARYTDDLILINKEDFDLANKKSMGKRRHLIKGVGIDLKHFQRTKKESNEKTYTISYVAELSKNKNQILLLEALNILKNEGIQVTVNLIGSGDNEEELQNYINIHNLDDTVNLLGYRKDIKDLLEDTDLVVATSLREGLPINIIESMAMGLPLIVTQCRGHIDLVKDNINGFVVPYDAIVLSEKIKFLMENPEFAKKMGLANHDKSKEYSIEEILVEMERIYKLK